MKDSTLKLSYPRPASLSDPFHDFTPEQCAKIIATPDAELTWHDFQCILGPHLPAGTYEEGAYFLPIAFNCLLADETHALDLVSSVVWFASEYSAQLSRDGVLEVVRASLAHCLEQWTSAFVFNHHHRVRHSETVVETTKSLVQFKTHQDLAVRFYVCLARTESDPINSAWFLESARAYRSKDVFRPPNVLEIREILSDDDLALKHFQKVRDSLAQYDSSEEYWQELHALFGIWS